MGSAQRRRSRGHGQEEDTRKHQIRRVGWTSILHSLMLNPDLPRRIHFMLDLRELGANKKPRHFSSQPGSRPNHKVRQGVPRQALLPTTKASNFSEVLGVGTRSKHIKSYLRKEKSHKHVILLLNT
ncbi:uncharacterized protein LOC135346856 isoform X1 [Halichondria panicea]|uniref:uncharacterized protein LOC135346856 isoform X1 n=1 Tax=Halichondria panicea TaxID=6063 RepID=UPI00312B48BC